GPVRADAPLRVRRGGAGLRSRAFFPVEDFQSNAIDCPQSAGDHVFCTRYFLGLRSCRERLGLLRFPIVCAVTFSLYCRRAYLSHERQPERIAEGSTVTMTMRSAVIAVALAAALLVPAQASAGLI